MRLVLTTRAIHSQLKRVVAPAHVQEPWKKQLVSQTEEEELILKHDLYEILGTCTPARLLFCCAGGLGLVRAELHRM